MFYIVLRKKQSHRFEVNGFFKRCFGPSCWFLPFITFTNLTPGRMTSSGWWRSGGKNTPDAVVEEIRSINFHTWDLLNCWHSHGSRVHQPQPPSLLQVACNYKFKEFKQRKCGWLWQCTLQTWWRCHSRHYETPQRSWAKLNLSEC